MELGLFSPSPVSRNVTVTSGGDNAYAILASDEFVLANIVSARTYTLPTAVGIQGKVYTIKKSVNNVNILTLATTSSQTIDGQSSTTLDTFEESITVVSDNANWQVRERRIPQIETAFTPTGSWSTNTTFTGSWHRESYFAVLQYKISVSGAPTSAALTLNLPNSWTVDESRLSIGVSNGVAKRVIIPSICSITDHSADRSYPGFIEYRGTNTIIGQVSISIDTDATGGHLSAVTQAAPFTFAVNDNVEITIKVPITGWNA